MPPVPGSTPWTSMVRAAEARPKERSPAGTLFAIGAVIVGIIAIVTVLVMVNGDGLPVTQGPLKAYLILMLGMGVFWLWMLIDAVVSPMDSGTKVMWVLLIVFLGVIGALAYAVMGRGSNR